VDGIRRAWSLSDVMIIHRSGLFSLYTLIRLEYAPESIDFFSFFFLFFLLFPYQFFLPLFLSVRLSVPEYDGPGDSESGRGRKGQRKQIKNGWVK
jgi:hypothetical protein